MWMGWLEESHEASHNHTKHKTQTNARVEARAGALAVVRLLLVLDERLQRRALLAQLGGQGVGALAGVRLADRLAVLCVCFRGVSSEKEREEWGQQSHTYT